MKNHAGLFQKGTSGNPGGRPKHKPVTDALRDILATREKINVLDDCPDDTNAVRIARKLFADAMTSDSHARVAIIDRTEGKPVQPIGGDEDSAPITHIVHEYVRSDRTAEDD